MLSVAFLVRNPPIDRFAQLVEFMRPVANEYVIVDTGSDERTLAVMRSWVGANVICAEWEDDFSKARNIGLAACTNEWTLVLDPDELPTQRMMEHLRATLNGANGAESAVGYMYFSMNFWAGARGPEIPSDWHIRLLRTGRGKFYRPVHELVMLDDQMEGNVRETSKCPKAPRDAYFIHSKGQDEIDKSTELYRRLSV
jgi:glycosyltransferase involved in cell wall biosynthesis